VRYCNTEQSVLGQCDLVSIVLPVRNDVHRNWASYINRSAGVFVNHNRVSPSSSVAYTLLWRLEPVSCFCSGGFFFFFFFWVGELFITHTWTCNERNHKCQTEGHPQPKLQATLTTWVEADTKVCKEATCQAKQAAHKAVVHQPTAKPVHFQETKHHLCLNQPNIAVKITSIMKCQAM